MVFSINIWELTSDKAVHRSCMAVRAIMLAGELVPCALVRYGLLGAIHPLGIMGCLPMSHPNLTSNHVSQLGEKAVFTVPSTGGK